MDKIDGGEWRTTTTRTGETITKKDIDDDNDDLNNEEEGKEEI